MNKKRKNEKKMPTAKELKAEAKTLGIAKYYKMNKKQLERAIEHKKKQVKDKEVVKEEEPKNEEKDVEFVKKEVRNEESTHKDIAVLGEEEALKEDILERKNPENSENGEKLKPVKYMRKRKKKVKAEKESEEPIYKEECEKESEECEVKLEVKHERRKKKSFETFRSLFTRIQGLNNTRRGEPMHVYQVLYIPENNEKVLARNRDFSGNILVGLFYQKRDAENALEEILNEKDFFGRHFLIAAEDIKDVERFSLDGYGWKDSYIIQKVQMDCVSENFLKRMFKI